MSEQLNSLEQRLTSLERANRQMKIVIATLFAFLIAPFIVPVAATQSAVPDVIRASRFEVVRNGVVVATVRSDDDGGIVDVKRASGEQAGYFAVEEDGGIVAVNHKSGNLAGYLGVDEDGGIVAVNKTSGNRVGYLGANADGGSLDISNSAGNSVGSIDAVESGAQIELGAGDGKTAVVIDVNNYHGRIFLGRGGKANVELGSDANGGSLDLHHGDQTDAIWLRGNQREPSINMMNGCINVLSTVGVRFTSPGC